MTRPVRSIRLEKRSSKSLDTLSGSSGEIFFDSDNNCLRVYTANQGGVFLIADRTWVANNTFNGDYNSLTNAPDLSVYATTTYVDSAIDTIDLTGYATEQYVTNALDSFEGGGGGGLADLSGSSISELSDVDDAEPTAGQVLKWDGAKWAPAADVTTGGVGLDATTLNGFGTPYYLDYANFTGVPTIPANLIDLGIADGLDGQVLTTDGSGGFTFQAVADGSWDSITGKPTFAAVATSGSYTDLSNTPTIPSSLLNLGISDGTSGQVLTTNGSGGFSFTTVTSGGGGLVVVQDDLNPSLGGTLNANGFNIDMGVYTITDSKVGQWDTAVSWGDHSTQGYLTSQTPESFTSLVQDTTPQLGGTLDANSQTIDMGVNTITDAKVGQWDTAVTWGDHAQAGYVSVSGGSLDIGSNNFFANDITATNDVMVTGDVSAATFTSSGAGAPNITSASTITLDAPDGTIVQNGPFRLPSLTTTERNALAAVNGDMIYNSTDNKAQVYENGAWVNLV
jgi:hypothetical protein